MRRPILPAALALTLAACSTTPPPAALPQAPSPLPAPRTGLTGLTGATQAQLAARFGAPSFVLREGPGLKLQWQNTTCVLDAYLYPPASGGGLAAVAHVDTRRPASGDSVPVEGCAASLTR